MSRLLTFSDVLVVLVVLAVLWPAGLLAAVEPAKAALASVFVGAAWISLMAVFETRDHRVLGFGPDEYRRTAAATTTALLLFATAGYVLQIDSFRPYVLFAFPIGVVALLAERWLNRKALHRRRRDGKGLIRVLIVAESGQAHDVVAALARARHAGYEAVGICVPEREAGHVAEVSGLPVLGSLADTSLVAAEVGADALAVLPSARLTAREMRWVLRSGERLGLDLLVSPALTDVAGFRLHVRSLPELPLIQVEQPRYSGPAHLWKALVDRLGALLALLVFGLPMLVIAVFVRAGSPGPVLFRQDRIGLEGTVFSCLKFRTMVIDAEERLAEIAHLNEAEGPLFKVRNDPRITKVGGFLRKYSLDELPQLLNVLRGEMSLVGPRPALPSEVLRYDEEARRRLLVKPGMTGLWQVSGRSDLPWDEAQRLDLYYVENWSPMADLLILRKTLGVMLRGTGGY